MAKEFLVSCPHISCNWAGHLPPLGDLEAWNGAKPSTRIVLFQCPHCYGEWHAQIINEDVQPVTLMDARMASV